MVGMPMNLTRPCHAPQSAGGTTDDEVIRRLDASISALDRMIARYEREASLLDELLWRQRGGERE